MIQPDRLQKLVSEVKMVGCMYTSAVTHPCNYPEIFSIEQLIGVEGLRAACAIDNYPWPNQGEGFVFHESQVERINRRSHDYRKQ
jgi:hypothetical protein